MPDENTVAEHAIRKLLAGNQLKAVAEELKRWAIRRSLIC